MINNVVIDYIFTISSLTKSFYPSGQFTVPNKDEELVKIQAYLSESLKTTTGSFQAIPSFTEHLPTKFEFSNETLIYKSSFTLLLQLWTVHVLNKIKPYDYVVKLLHGLQGKWEDLLDPTALSVTGIGNNKQVHGFYEDCERRLSSFESFLEEEYCFSTFVDSVLNGDLNLDEIQIFKNHVKAKLCPPKRLNQLHGESNKAEKNARQRHAVIYGTSPLKSKSKRGANNNKNVGDLSMLVAALKNLKIVKGSFLDQSRLSELLQYLLQHDIITGVIPDESQLGKVLQTAETVPISLLELDTARKLGIWDKRQFKEEQKNVTELVNEPSKQYRNKSDWDAEQYMIEGMSQRQQNVGEVLHRKLPVWFTDDPMINDHLENLVITDEKGQDLDQELAAQARSSLSLLLDNRSAAANSSTKKSRSGNGRSSPAPNGGVSLTNDTVTTPQAKESPNGGRKRKATSDGKREKPFTRRQRRQQLQDSESDDTGAPS